MFYKYIFKYTDSYEYTYYIQKKAFVKECSVNKYKAINYEWKKATLLIYLINIFLFVYKNYSIFDKDEQSVRYQNSLHWRFHTKVFSTANNLFFVKDLHPGMIQFRLNTKIESF